ncbi:MAG: peptidylprolyl isomerase [Oscillospiraceae bacterium]|nr:peptidylprolyl isomerase [Oscillospiraceae bacterium]
MKFRRILTLVLALAMMLALASCGNTAVQDDTTPADSTETMEAASYYDSFKPGDVVMTVDGEEYTWADYYYLLNYYISYYNYYNGEVTDWNAEISTGVTAQKAVKDACRDWIIYDKAIRNGAEQLGVALDDADLAAIEANIVAMEENAGGAEEFARGLAEMKLTRDFYTEISKTSSLADKCYFAVYGEYGSKLSDEEVAEYTANDGYLMAKHILIKFPTAAEGEEDFDEEAAKDEAYARILEIKDQIDACDSDELESVFTELMNANSEDTGGLYMYPNGYLFQDGEMVSEFENGTKALEIGEVSDVIETSYGYHLILRLPINYDVTPNAYSSYVQSGYTEYTLRNLTAMKMFDSIISGWREAVTAENGKIYDKIDLSKLLK